MPKSEAYLKHNFRSSLLQVITTLWQPWHQQCCDITTFVASQFLWLVVFASYVTCLVVTRVPLPAHEFKPFSIQQYHTVTSPPATVGPPTPSPSTPASDNLA